MVIFKYVEDKDVFQKFYSKMFAKRLVQQNSASDDAEETIISKLRVMFFAPLFLKSSNLMKSFKRLQMKLTSTRFFSTL